MTHPAKPFTEPDASRLAGEMKSAPQPLYEAMVDQAARALDGPAFHEYQPGECLPRGHETDGIEKVNEIQGFRRRTAISRAKKVLASIGIHPAPAQQ